MWLSRVFIIVFFQLSSQFDQFAINILDLGFHFYDKPSYAQTAQHYNVPYICHIGLFASLNLT